MSSACVCHIEGEWCLYCEMYVPMEEAYKAENNRADKLQAENDRMWHVIEEMRTTWKPADHCDSCAHLEMELKQHKTVRKSYLEENKKLKEEIARINCDYYADKQRFVVQRRELEEAKERADKAEEREKVLKHAFIVMLGYVPKTARVALDFDEVLASLYPKEGETT